jgi:hypothetical protein
VATEFKSEARLLMDDGVAIGEIISEIRGRTQTSGTGESDRLRFSKMHIFAFTSGQIFVTKTNLWGSLLD